MKSCFSLEFASMSDTGKIRSHNEDAVIVSGDAGFVVLADGMGGYNAGEVASSMATTIIQQVIESQIQESLLADASATVDTAGAAVDHPTGAEALLVNAIESANLAIFDASVQVPDYTGMGTTVVVALFHDHGVTVAHVGDSRAYRLRDGVLSQITRDHSLLQEQIDAGLITVEQAKFAQHKNLITRAVGVDVVIDIESSYFEVLAGDCYLLCSDGLSDMLSDVALAEIVDDCGENITAATGKLVAQANENGGRDNISVILVRVAHAV